METVMNTLPDQDLMCAQMAVSFTLSMIPADEVIMTLRNQTKPTSQVFLGEFPMKLFTTAEPLEVLAQFTAEIKRIGVEIEKRFDFGDNIYQTIFKAIHHGPFHTNTCFQRMSRAELICDKVLY